MKVVQTFILKGVVMECQRHLRFSPEIIILVVCLNLAGSDANPVPGLAARVSYSGHSLIRTFPTNADQREAIRKLECHLLKEPLLGDVPTELLCREGAHALRSLSDLGIRSEVAAADFESVLEQERLEQQVETVSPFQMRAGVEQQELDFKRYHSFDVMTSYLERLAKENPDLVTLRNVGLTEEGRPLFLIKVGKSPQGDLTRAIWIDAGIHAREWIAPAAGFYVLDRLVKHFRQEDKENRKDNDDDMTNVDWYFMPMLNPDGYEYSRSTDRLWRKNRASTSDPSCFGVDLNRNWGVEGFGVGASRHPCSNTYQGPKENSEPEVRTAEENLLAVKDNVRASISLHSQGNMWLTSWGYKSELPVDNNKLVSMGEAAVSAIKEVNGREYTVGAAGKIFYPAGGASDDFAKAKAHIPYAVTVELPGDGRGFLLPASKIEGVGRELFAGFRVVSAYVRKEPLGLDESYQRELSTQNRGD